MTCITRFDTNVKKPVLLSFFLIKALRSLLVANFSDKLLSFSSDLFLFFRLYKIETIAKSNIFAQHLFSHFCTFGKSAKQNLFYLFDRCSFDCPYQHPPLSSVSTGKPAPKIHQWTIYLCRLRLGWVDKVQCFWSARWFGAVGSLGARTFAGFLHDIWLLSICLEILFPCTTMLLWYPDQLFSFQSLFCLPFCFEAPESMRISSYEPVSGQTYENGYIASNAITRTQTITVKSQMFVRYLFLYFRTFKKSAKFNTGRNLFFVLGPSNFNVVLF